MYEIPPSHPRYQLILTRKVEQDIEIFVFDHLKLVHEYYSQKNIKLIENKELKTFLFSIRRYINEGRYEIMEELY